MLKNFAEKLTEVVKDVPEGTPIEIWFQGEARIGQKNGLVYQWAKKGTRPRQPKDQRYVRWSRIFAQSVKVYPIIDSETNYDEETSLYISI